MVNFIRSSWGNQAASVTASQVAEVRTTPWPVLKAESLVGDTTGMKEP